MPDTPDGKLRKAPLPRTVIALDFGTRRIGVATGNGITRSAQPLTTLNAAEPEGLWLALDRIVAEWQPDQLLVGFPDRDENGATRDAAVEFADALKARYGRPLDMVAEHLTSFAAEAELRESRREGRKARPVRPGEIDAVAARLIAEQWLNARDD